MTDKDPGHLPLVIAAMNADRARNQYKDGYEAGYRAAMEHAIDIAAAHYDEPSQDTAEREAREIMFQLKEILKNRKGR